MFSFKGLEILKKLQQIEEDFGSSEWTQSVAPSGRDANRSLQCILCAALLVNRTH